MNMNAEMRQDEDLENTAVELDGDDDSSSDYESEASDSRTNVQDEDSELENYSENVRKRINQLTAKRKQAMEEAQAAYEYAQRIKAENDQIKSRLSQLDKGYMTEYESRVSTQEAQAKRAMAEAYEAGDYEKVAEAQAAISRIEIEKERIRLRKIQAENQANQVQNEPEQHQQARRQQPQPQEDPKLQAWLGKNKWFGTDRIMTSAAKAIHEELVLEHGYDPTSDDYYAEIDRRMRRELPHKFQADRRSAQAVTPASSGRSKPSGRKQAVELTPGQVAFANKMRIPLDVYAKEVAKINARSN